MGAPVLIPTLVAENSPFVFKEDSISQVIAPLKIETFGLAATYLFRIVSCVASWSADCVGVQ